MKKRIFKGIMDLKDLTISLIRRKLVEFIVSFK